MATTTQDPFSTTPTQAPYVFIPPTYSQPATTISATAPSNGVSPGTTAGTVSAGSNPAQPTAAKPKSVLESLPGDLATSYKNNLASMLSGDAYSSQATINNEGYVRAASALRARTANANVGRAGQGTAIANMQGTEQGILQTAAATDLQNQVETQAMKERGIAGVNTLAGMEQTQEQINLASDKQASDEKWKAFDQALALGSDEDVLKAYNNASGQNLDMASIAQIRGYGRKKMENDLTVEDISIKGMELKYGADQYKAISDMVATGATLDQVNAKYGNGTLTQAQWDSMRQYSQAGQFYSGLSSDERRFYDSLTQSDRQFYEQLDRSDRQFFEGLASSERQFYSGLNSDERRYFAGLAQSDRQFYSQLDSTERQFYSGLSSDEKRFFAGLDQDNMQFYSTLNQNDRQFYANLNQDDRQFYSQLDSNERQYYAGLDQNDKQFYSQLGSTERLAFANMASDEKMYFQGLAQADRQFYAGLDSDERKYFTGLDRADQQFYRQLDSTERMFYSGLDAEQQRFYSTLAQSDRQFYAGLDSTEQMFYANLNQDQQQFYSQLGQDERQFYAGLESNEKLTYAQLGQADRQFYAGLNQADRQFYAGLDSNNKQFFAQLNSDEQKYYKGLEQNDRQFYSTLNQSDRQFFAGLEKQDQQFYAQLSSTQAYQMRSLDVQEKGLALERYKADQTYDINNRSMKIAEAGAEADAYWDGANRFATYVQTHLDMLDGNGNLTGDGMMEAAVWFEAKYGQKPDITTPYGRAAIDAWGSAEVRAAQDNRLTNSFDATMYAVDSSTTLTAEQKTLWKKIMADPKTYGITIDKDGNVVAGDGATTETANTVAAVVSGNPPTTKGAYTIGVSKPSSAFGS
jgi:uncharacterized pyridoxamine 5'-phosphate oxidase family protein